ncbi:MAG: NADH-quinone oxidoreductase subunit NuoE [Symbiopectobacterium sp.]
MKHHYEDARVASIEALKIFQKHRGWVPDGAIHAIADIFVGSDQRCGRRGDVLQPDFPSTDCGRHVIRYCDSVVCYINCFQGVKAAFERKLKIKPGQTTFDGRFTLVPICCLGNCDKGSSMMIDEDTHSHVKPDDIDSLLEPYQ